MVYKHFVPTGLRTFFSKLFVATDKSNTLTDHYAEVVHSRFALDADATSALPAKRCF